MEAELISRWNSVVDDYDTVFHLGDFTLGDMYQARRLFSRLNGRIIVLANEWHHDRRWILDAKEHPMSSMSGYDVSIASPMFVFALPEVGARRHPQVIVLCHYPLAEWERKHYGAWHLHGHSHGTYQYPDGTKALDVGVDCHDFYPISLDEVVRRLR
jgi:calcineurin-like phosphoesterase family protein